MTTESNEKPTFLSASVEQERIFYKNPSTEKEGIQLICGGWEKVTAQYQIDRESFPHFVIEWVADGTGSLWLGKDTYPLQPGSFFAYGPGVHHQIKTDPDARLVKYFLDFEGLAAGDLLQRYKLNIPSFRQLPTDCGILELFDSIIDAGSSQLANAPRLAELLLEGLILLASENYPKTSTLQSRAFQTYQRCEKYIARHYRSIQRTHEIAQACHLETTYMTRLFKRFGKTSPHRQLVQMKMNAAALQLLRRGALVKEVADEFGYADPYHFSKSFKKVHGLSPEHYVAARRP